MGSNHYPVRCRIGIEVGKCQEQKIPRWGFKTVDWEKFKELRKAGMSNVENDRRFK